MQIGLQVRTFFMIVMTIAVSSCNQIRNIADVFVKPTARELYAREFEKQDSLSYNKWHKEFLTSKNDSLQIRLPYVEQGAYFKNRLVVYTYNLFLEEGVIFNIIINNEILGTRCFIDLLKLNEDGGLKDVMQNNYGENNLKFKIVESGVYKVLIQPELKSQGLFSVEIYNTPSFGFPVLGKGNSAVQGFWGAVRDGGARSHEGIDIFAERKTPVVAAVVGRVSSTGERGLGGKQVWLKAGLFGESLYYAHLDTILVSTGSKVEIGDTLGLVGNTGNARTTAPHLHFGIYKTGKGAINPLPFVKVTERLSFKPLSSMAKRSKISSKVANIRNAPTVSGTILGEIKRNDTVSLLGYTENWAHVQLKDGKGAFIYKGLISDID